ncbi:MAG: hypothetical protein ACRC28_18195 [Clostridium sp.]|uniref:hypothetical protein n=1 Tax=Clostridium sp. TaxID=1506 RepID=UPI003F2E9BAC
MGSRKKHRNRENEVYGNGGMENNNPLGLDFNTLSSLLGNIDQNQLMSMVQMLGQNGINMDNMGNAFNNMGNNSGFNNGNNNNSNNMNYGNDKNYNSNSNYGNNENLNNEKKSGELDTSTLINKLMGNSNEKSYEAIEQEKKLKEEKESMENDPNIEMLLAIRKIVNKDRVRFIDRVIQLYLKGEFGEF